MSDRLIPKETPKASHGRGGVGPSLPSPALPSLSPPLPPSPQPSPQTPHQQLKPNTPTGNIGPTSNDARNNLVTPTIKQSIYTTGRGGSGNMKKNDPNHPEVARKSQDVAPMPTRRNSRGEVVHTGRGGVANILRPSIDERVHTAAGGDEDTIMTTDEKDDNPPRQMKDGGAGGGGDWWRDDMANGRARGAR
ncbi:MAG: hypothetical protein L6R37_003874 [Teloschistes peruensis]|nr:MAG: hypothetical protein L6R37_003874 [Teloschistes peruensis]